MNQEVSHIDAAIADLEAWREQISVAIETLRHFGAKGLALPSTPPNAGRIVNGDIPGDAFFQMTVPDAAEKYLRLAKATKEIPDIAEALLKGGLKSSSKNFSDMTRTVISRDDRFVKVPKGGWGLAEWYPAMRKEKKTKSPKGGQPQREPEPQVVQRPTEPTENAGEKILAAIRSNPLEEWTATKLTGATGLKKKTVQGTIFRLRHEGKITNRVGGMGYVIAGAE
jgi:hypothetical protein